MPPNFTELDNTLMQLVDKWGMDIVLERLAYCYDTEEPENAS